MYLNVISQNFINFFYSFFFPAKLVVKPVNSISYYIILFYNLISKFCFLILKRRVRGHKICVVFSYAIDREYFVKKEKTVCIEVNTSGFFAIRIHQCYFLHRVAEDRLSILCGNTSPFPIPP